MNGFVVPIRSLRNLRPAEWAKELEIRKRQQFDAAIKDKHGDSFTIPASAPNPQEDDGSFDPDCFGEKSAYIPEAEIVDANGKPLSPTSVAYTLVNTEVLLPQGEGSRLARVICRFVDENGEVIGDHNNNPILNTILYNVEFPDGVIKPYAAYTIAENILASVYLDGYHSQII